VLIDLQRLEISYLFPSELFIVFNTTLTNYEILATVLLLK